MSISDDILDKFIRRDIVLQRVEKSLTDDATDLLISLEKELIKALSSIDPTSVKGSYREKRLLSLIAEVRGITRSHYSKMNAAHRNSLKKLFSLETEAVADMVNDAVGASIMTHTITPELLSAAVTHSPIRTGINTAAPLKEWWGGQSDDLVDAFSQNMRMGVTKGESLGELIARVKGGKVNGEPYPGIMKASRRHAETLVRTSAQQILNNARQSTYDQNSDIIKGTQQYSVLDTRTSDICIALANEAWYLSNKRPIPPSTKDYPGIPPLHPNCRSSHLPILWEAQKMPKKKRDKIAAKTRAAMNGQVAQDIKFDEWLRNVERTHPGSAKKLLGKERARLFLEGRLDLKDLVDGNNQRLSLDELEKRGKIKKRKKRKKK